jgi:hypothetical protein
MNEIMNDNQTKGDFRHTLDFCLLVRSLAGPLNFALLTLFSFDLDGLRRVTLLA